MGQRYHHLTFNDRFFLSHLYNKEKLSIPKIAEILGFHRSTVYREIQRNRYKVYVGNTTRKVWTYCHAHARDNYLSRRKRGLKIDKHPKLQAYVHKRLMQGFSPWQIEWSVKYHDKDQVETGVSHETIYCYIYSHWKRRVKFYECLRRKHISRQKKGDRRSRIKEGMLIKNRPKVVNAREEFGHWECDLMMFEKGINGNFITLVERLTRYTIAIRQDNKKASSTAIAMIQKLTPLKPFVRSITLDQGIEFARHQWLKSCLEADIYFCDPGSPHQKGSIENRNGVLRTVFPRDYALDNLSEKHLEETIHHINSRPMKCLAYNTPQRMFTKCACLA